MVTIYRGGATGLRQQNRRSIRSQSSKKTKGILKEIKDTMKSEFNFDLVIIHVGIFYEIIEEDAVFFRDNFGFKLHKNPNISYERTGFGIDSIKKYKEKLLNMNKQFCIINQIDSKTENITRKVIFSTIDNALNTQF
jgi:DNA mismatch repair ATPase MutS